MNFEELKTALLQASCELLPYTEQFIVESLPREIRYLHNRIGTIVHNRNDFTNCIGPFDADQAANALWHNGVIPEWVRLEVLTFDRQFTYVLVTRGRGITDSAHFRKYPEIYPRSTPFQCCSPPIPPNPTSPTTGPFTGERFSLFWEQAYRVPWKARLLGWIYSSWMYAAYHRWRYSPSVYGLETRYPGPTHVPFQWRIGRLLHRLEGLDPSITANSRRRNSDEKRKLLREQIIAGGVQGLRTVLKDSRREGWQYRQDVYSIIQALADDPVYLFITGLTDSDRDVRWSSAKWLRDTGQGEDRAVRPLIDYMKRHPWLRPGLRAPGPSRAETSPE